MSRAMMLGLAGLMGGFCAFALREPSRPSTAFSPGWAQWEIITGLVLGLLMGLLLGLCGGIMQGSRAHATKGVLLGAIIGGAGGAIGISLGSVVYSALQSMSSFFLPIQLVARMAGWALMGGIVGLVMGAVGMSWKRAWVGMVGGVLGGALGGFAFEIVATMLGPAQLAVQGRESGEVGTIPRAVGFSVLGLGIGLLIGIVEALSRKAWVRLILGRNEGKDWAIDAHETFFGRAETAHIPLLGDTLVEPFHACIRKEHGRYLIIDMQSPIGIAVNGVPTRQAYLESGDTFQIGHFTLQFFLSGAPRVVRTPQVQAAQFQPVPASPNAQTVGAAPMQQMVSMSTPTVMTPATASPSPLLALVALAGPLAGQKFTIHQPTELGRESVAVPMGFDHQASRRHVRIEPTSGGLQISDLGSTNGTMVNGVRVQNHLARIGDSLTIGNTTFRIEPA